MLNYKDEIEAHFHSNTDFEQIVRSYYLVYPTCAFSKYYKEADEILNKISDYLSIPINDIVVCGSAKLGYSPVKQQGFKLGSSDLDLAILNSNCYFNIFDTVLKVTRNYTRKDLFVDDKIYDRYMYGVSRGMINYNFLPNINTKTELVSFFDEISIKYRSLFSSISCCFYASEYSFKQKQINSLTKWKSNLLK